MEQQQADHPSPVDNGAVRAALSPTHPDPAVRVAYFAQQASDTITLGDQVGLSYAVERALTEMYYAGVQEGIARYREAALARLREHVAEADRG